MLAGFSLNLWLTFGLQQFAYSHNEVKEIAHNATPPSAGFKALEDGDCNRALEIFNSAAREHPDSAEVHHGRARALALLGRKDEAVKEFKLSILLNPSEDIAKKSKEGLRCLGEPVEEKDFKAHLKPSSAAPETVRSADVEQSINRMLKQSEEKMKDIQTSSERYASTVYNERSNANNRLMEQARQEADELRRMRVRVGRRSRPAFNQSDIMARQAELQYRSTAQLERSKSDYDNRKLEAESRALGVKNSVEGLESQMLTKPSETSGVFLVPTGTNLYVRNYGHFDPVMPEPPEPLHAVPLKLPQVLKIEEHSGKKKRSRKETLNPTSIE